MKTPDTAPKATPGLCLSAQWTIWYDQGYSIQQIANAANVEYMQVWRLFNDLRITLRKDSR
ncbi:hypothetical protein HUW46_02086 [Amycolatopsis sp. CA-230715]|nr:hypothetical protein HUW46_02086 [Amycolatopsis sp. CA-230715]